MKLLRKLRRKLIDAGKFKSYLLYALGEIVLIVIAVSIAWKINDLNDIRKNNLAEDKIYLNLNEELDTNLRLVKRIIEEDTQKIIYLENTLNYIGNSDTELSQSAKDSIINIGDSTFELQDSSINSIVSTSKLETIESTKLKDLIATYLTKIESFKSQDAQVKAIVSNKIKPILEQHISLVDLLPNEKKYIHAKVHAVRSNYSALLANKAYQNSLIDRLLGTQNRLNLARTIRSKTKILLSHLKQELQ
ncbi:MAG: hypothetical protein ABJM36_04545 [Algibacter sp.]|uniref:hypothetical protein n=1 Tax=Algibacter sp. TaxID=1872428 RepID=UPI003297D4E6